MVDAYTKRIFISLGLIDQKAKYSEIKENIEKVLEVCIKGKKERTILYQEYHALIVNHAKEFYSRKPYGLGCVLQE